MSGKEIVCTVCPASCRLTVREENGAIVVEGYGCRRGLEHGINEYAHPMRVLTTTVAIHGGALPRLPVISRGEIPKAKLRECLAALYRVRVDAPVKCDDVIVENICGTGADIVASRSMKMKEEI